jgi:multiple sugar transport system substrate-binding protein
MQRDHVSLLSKAAALAVAGALAAGCTFSGSASSPTPGSPSSAAPAASGSAAAASGSAPAATPGETVKLRFWEYAYGPNQFTDTIKKLTGQFNAEHPGIEVTWELVSDYSQSFTTALAAGTAPDVTDSASWSPFEWYDANQILPIDDLVAQWKADGFANDFVPGSLEAYNYKGHYISAPWLSDVRVLWYRKDKLAAAGIKPPTTWAELRAAAKTLSSQGKHAFSFCGDDLGWQQVDAFLIGNGGGFFSPDGKVDVANPRNVEALQFIQDMIRDGSISPGAAGLTFADANKDMANDAVFNVNAALFNEQLNDPNVVALPLLTGPHGDKFSLGWPGGLSIFSQTKHPAEAKVFLDWWVRHDDALWTEGNSQVFPARKSTIAALTDPNAKILSDSYYPFVRFDSALAPGTFPQLNKIETSGDVVAWVQDILNLKPIDEANAKLQKAYTAIMGQ